MVRAWRVSLGGNRDPHSAQAGRQSSLTSSRLRANRGLTRWQKICSRCGADRPLLTKSQIWTLVTPEAQTKCRFRVPTYHRGPLEHLPSTIFSALLAGRLG